MPVISTIWNVPGLCSIALLIGRRKFWMCFEREGIVIIIAVLVVTAWALHSRRRCITIIGRLISRSREWSSSKRID